VIRKKGCLIVFAATVAFLALAITSFFAYCHIARERWKDQAIAEIAAFTENKVQLASEISTLEKARGASAASNGNDLSGTGWLSNRMILMKNGEWLAYTSCNAHESPLVRDHFIAKGSDGKWYYTSNHFCKGMLCLLQDIETPPTNLSFFIRAYHLKAFDGKSGECLNETCFSPDYTVLHELNSGK